MKSTRELLLLYAVTDRSWVGKSTLLAQIEEALQAGVTLLQLREKDLDQNTFKEEALAVQKLCKRYNVPLIINDNVSLAIDINADGVHVGQGDQDAKEVRALIGPDKILGVSCQTVEQAMLAERDGANYLGVGAVFSTQTKLDASTTGIQVLHDICHHICIPVVAIGGIQLHNIKQLQYAGIAGVAVVSAIFAAPNITKAVENLILETKQVLKTNKVLVFDFDGTIVDSVYIWNTFAFEYLQHKNIVVPEDIATILEKMTFLEGIEYLKKTYDLPINIKQTELDMKEHMKNRFLKKATLKPGIADFLKYAYSKKISIYILTANTEEIVSLILDTYDLKEYITDIVTCDMLGMAKSTEYVFLFFADLLSIETKDMVVFEDTYHAALSAKKAGCQVIGVKDSYQQEEIQKVVDIFIENFEEMEEYI